jgi:hypothetical protein
MKNRLPKVAVSIPILGLLALVGRAEVARLHGPTWTIPITGYDPRDLLHGQYLQYQYRFSWAGESTCGPPARRGWWGDEGWTAEVPLSPGCCLCLIQRAPGDGVDPWVRQIPCGAADDQCDATVRSESVMPPLRYYVPEDQALALESQLRTRDAGLELTVGGDGAPAIHGLVLDGRPWREALGR